jgi:Ig domain protein group 2 domain protein
MKKFSVLLLCAIFATTSFFSCKQPAKDDEKPVEIASIKVDPSSITLNKGETSTLKATITPSNAPQGVKWESDAPEKVSVDASGKITAKDIGTANVKVTSLKDATKSATCVVTVVKPVVAIDVEVQMPDGFVDVTQMLPEAGIPYTATHTDCNPAGKFILKASVKDEKLKDKTIVGKVSKPDATPPLTLKAVANNTFELTFSKVETSTPCTLNFYIEDEEAKKEISFNLLPEPEITKIECESAEITLGKNFTYQIKEPKLTYNPSKIGSANAETFVLNATKKITYTSNNDATATVNESGEVQTKAPGEAIISMETTNGKKATLKITVENQVSPNKLNLSHEYINLKVRETKDITINPEPSNGSLLITDWTNSNATVGKIEKKSANTYTVTALSKGETTFEATSKFNPNVKLAIHLTVSDKLVMSVKIEPARLTVEKDETKSLTATITPAEAPQKVRWESNKPDTVSVDENGNITAKDFGVAVIKAISLADSTKTGTCVVIVAASAGSVKLDKELLELKYNESFTLTATIEPVTAPQEVTWSCDDEAILTYTSAGVITAKSKAGKATITATSQSDSSKKAHCVVYVAGAKVASIKLSEDSFEMDTNGEKDFTVEVLPSSSTGDLDYEIEGENLTLKKFKKTGAYYENKYSCTVKSGNLEETKKITFWSKANPAIKAILNITTVAPKVQSVTVEDKTISLDTMDEKMSATVLPTNAVQTVKWTSKDTNVVMIDENSGQLTPFKAGEATIVATSTADPTKKAEAKVTVKATVTSFEVAVDKSYIHFGGDVATLTVTPVPADAFGDFVCETECEDLSIAKVDGNDNAFTIKVKNKSAKTASATLKVKSKAVTTLAEKTKTIQIATIVPRTISIEGDDKMYLSEELQFTINATAAGYGAPTPDKSVKWEADKSYTGANKLGYYDVDVKEDGKVKLRDAGWDYPGRTFRIKATSLLDESVVATKVITICKDIAKITSVRCPKTEWTHCKEANTSVYNGIGGLSVYIGLEGYSDEHRVYKKFVVSENSSPPYAEHHSMYLAKTLYESITSSFTLVNLSTKSYTYGEVKKFYVWPIDPKTDRPITTGEAHTFDLLIWAEPEEIEFMKGSFNIYPRQSGGFESAELKYGTSGHYFYARITPQYAKQDWLDYEIVRNSGNYTCIVNHKKSDTQDKDGWTRYQFDTNGDNTWAAHDYASFVFDVVANNGKPNPRITNFLMIDSN